MLLFFVFCLTLNGDGLLVVTRIGDGAGSVRLDYTNNPVLTSWLIKLKFRFVTCLLAVSVAYVLAALTASASEGRLPSAPVVPHETSVLLLPALDVSAESTNMLGPRQAVIRHREQFEFITRRFKVLGETMAVQAAHEVPGFDLNQVVARKPENLDALANRAGADWVVRLVVEKAKLELTSENTFTVRTRVRLQIRDSRRRDWLVDGTFEGQANGVGSPVFVFKDSLDDAVKRALGTLLDPYPKEVTVLEENGLKDYLVGQTKPFLADPAKPFSGLSAVRDPN